VARFAVLDTTVFAHLTKDGPHTARYRALLDGYVLGLSFQADAELMSADYAIGRQLKLQALAAMCVRIPHTDATSRRYADVSRIRRGLRRQRAAGSDASDADAWIISSAIEHGADLLSHDAQQVALARAMGLDVYTALPRLRAGNPSR
jgi:predicted nucleic acid-binding protein